MNSIDLGKFIAKLRQEKGLTQENLAEILNIDKRKISRWETGTSMPEFDMLIKLSEILDVSLYELSICERIPDEKLLNKAKLHFKNALDLKKYKKKRILLTIISIILGIFIGLSILFTINNYQQYGFYSLESIDEKYELKANYIKIGNYNFLNITSIKDSDGNIYYIDTDDKITHYEILDIEKKLLIKNNLLLVSNDNYYNYKFTNYINLYKNTKYILRIYYDNNAENEDDKYLDVNFKLKEIYTSKLLNNNE